MEAAEALRTALGNEAREARLALDAVAETIAELRAATGLDGPGARHEAQPRESDLEILGEFLSDQRSNLQELEELVTGLDDDEDGDVLRTLKGRIHTLKGEAGVLGLRGASELCHALEDEIAARGHAELRPVFEDAVGWLRSCFQALEAGEAEPERLVFSPRAPAEPAPEPQGRATEPVTTSDAPAAPTVASVPSAPAPAEPSHPASSASEAACRPFELTGDPELTGDFVVEAREHLDDIDVQLLALEKDPGAEEAIHAAFRAFHTIKGIAGFLNLPTPHEVAHEAETLLDHARNGTAKLTGHTLELVFASGDCLKKLVAGIEHALATGEPVVPPDNVGALLNAMEAAARGDVTEVPPATVPTPVPKASPEAGKRASPEQDSSGGDGPKRKGVLVRETIKVDAQRLDELVDMIGELVIAEAMLSQSEELKLGDAVKLPSLVNHMDKITRELQERAMSLRMVPIRSTFMRQARLARDVASKLDKAIEFVTAGDETELDKNVVDAIGDPLVHLVRNAVDHGMECSQEERVAQGKPGVGRIELRAYHQSGSIYIELRDDGRGLNREKILAKARSRGIVGEDESLSDSEVYNLIFAPGFSTAEAVTDVSGRGVGLDVVRRNIGALRGSVDVSSEPGKGSVFTIRLPLTLAIIDGMVVRLGCERYVIPTVSIVRMIRPDERVMTSVFERSQVLRSGDDLIPMIHLDELFELDEPLGENARTSIVIVEHNQCRIAFAVDEVIGQQQIVIKPLGAMLNGISGLAGGAIMPDGHVGLIVDIAGVAALAGGERESRAVA